MLVPDLAAAEMPIEKPAGIVAQHPDDRGRAALRDQPLEQSEQQRPADTLVLPVRRDVKRKDLAGMLGAVPVPTAAAEPDDLALSIDGNADIVRLAPDDGRPPDFAALRRQADKKLRGQDSGISSPPRLDIESGDAAGIAGACGTDRDRAHVGPLCPVFPHLGRGETRGSRPPERALMHSRIVGAMLAT